MSEEKNEKRAERRNKICELVESEFYTPMKEKELAAFMQVDKSDRGELSDILSELVLEGRLMLTPKGKYMKGDGSIVVGSFISNAKGFGFVRVAGREEDLFIPEDKTGGAFHQDIVQVALLKPGHGKRQEAQVLKIVQRGITTLVGTYERSREHYGFVIPDNGKIPCDIFVPAECSMGAMTGHKVVVEITDYGTGEREGAYPKGAAHNPQGRVVEILGHINDPGVEILSLGRADEVRVECGER
ncbi:MAG: ribonuclease R, partial [Acetatifactor sp.]|nr:ribonuclease R [Acetatifactor sp.]